MSKQTDDHFFNDIEGGVEFKPKQLAYVKSDHEEQEEVEEYTPTKRPSVSRKRAPPVRRHQGQRQSLVAANSVQQSSIFTKSGSDGPAPGVEDDSSDLSEHSDSEFLVFEATHKGDGGHHGGADDSSDLSEHSNSEFLVFEK